uniref:TrbP n=2 Tax=Pseudomonadota TaxID=1224 RepID=Q76M26_DELAC|nr:TrbP [Delftia acidovorans]
MKALRIPDGTVEALKWLALVLMTGDHVNKYLFNATLPVLFEAGRVALPLFVFVLAYNLARPGTLERGVYGRTMSRLAMFGALASVPFVALGGLYAGWWPLNVMFTLLVVTATAYLVERGGKLHLAAAGVVFLVGGSSVEYWWPAVAFGLAVWSYTRRPSWAAAAVAVLACAALWFVNRNLWALAALPVLFLASRVDVRVPRLRWAFYAYYPLHLASLWLIRIPMSKAGYLLSFSEDDCTIQRGLKPLVHTAPDSQISGLLCTKLVYAQYSCAPKRDEHGDRYRTDYRARRGHPARTGMGACASSRGDHWAVGAVGDGWA